MRELVVQALRFVVLAAVVFGVTSVSDWPTYRAIPDAVGYLTLSFSHGGDRRAACRPLTAEELADLPPNMRRREVCPRRRPPIRVELEVDGETLFAADVPPSGIAGDGPSRVFERFELPGGVYEVAVRMRDRPGAEGFTHRSQARLAVAPAANRVIDFRPEAGGFQFY